MAGRRRGRTSEGPRAPDMDRQQFIAVTAVALFAAFLLGWFASWLIHRLTRATRLGEWITRKASSPTCVHPK